MTEIERLLDQKKKQLNNWMKRELNTRDGVEGIVDSFVSNTLMLRAIQQVRAGAQNKFTLDSNDMDNQFDKTSNTKLAMQRFRESTDKKEIILHMQKPLEFEQKIFKSSYEEKLDYYVVLAKEEFKNEMVRVIEVIKGFISQWKQIFHNKNEAGVKDEDK